MPSGTYLGFKALPEPLKELGLPDGHRKRVLTPRIRGQVPVTALQGAAVD